MRSSISGNSSFPLKSSLNSNPLSKQQQQQQQQQPTTTTQSSTTNTTAKKRLKWNLSGIGCNSSTEEKSPINQQQFHSDEEGFVDENDIPSGYHHFSNGAVLGSLAATNPSNAYTFTSGCSSNSHNQNEDEEDIYPNSTRLTSMYLSKLPEANPLMEKSNRIKSPQNIQARMFTQLVIQQTTTQILLYKLDHKKVLRGEHWNSKRTEDLKRKEEMRKLGWDSKGEYISKVKSNVNSSGTTALTSTYANTNYSSDDDNYSQNPYSTAAGGSTAAEEELNSKSGLFEKYMGKSSAYELVYSKYDSEKPRTERELKRNFAGYYVNLLAAARTRSSDDDILEVLRALHKPIVLSTKQESTLETNSNHAKTTTHTTTNPVFDSRFESGNLMYAFRHDQSAVTSMEYDLVLQNDVNSKGYAQWFYFSVSNVRKGTTITFNIVNHAKRNSLFEKGMKPAVFSVKKNMQAPAGMPTAAGVGWEREGSDIKYFKNSIVKERSKDSYYYSLRFSYKFDFDDDTVYFAMSLPYTYSSMLRHLDTIKAKSNSDNSLFVKIEDLCQTIAGNPVPLLTISNQQQQNDQESSQKAKRVAFIIGRQHPGETVSSYVMQGLIDFLSSSHSIAIELRRTHVFKIIPMVNPDGVIFGNFRCNLSGMDLNRQWSNPSKQLHPSVFTIRRLIMSYQQQAQEMDYFIDLHGHSKKLNAFLYACKTTDSEINACCVFPMILSKLNRMYDFDSCTFGLESFKETTARGVAWGCGMKKPNIFTVEVSFFGHGNNKATPQSDSVGVPPISQFGRHFTLEDLRRLGEDLARTINLYNTEYSSPDEIPSTLTTTLTSSTQYPQSQQSTQSNTAAAIRKQEILNEIEKKQQLYSSQRKCKQNASSDDSGSDSDPLADELNEKEKQKNSLLTQEQQQQQQQKLLLLEQQKHILNSSVTTTTQSQSQHLLMLQHQQNSRQAESFSQRKLGGTSLLQEHNKSKGNQSDKLPKQQQQTLPRINQQILNSSTENMKTTLNTNDSDEDSNMPSKKPQALSARFTYTYKQATAAALIAAQQKNQNRSVLHLKSPSEILTNNNNNTNSNEKPTEQDQPYDQSLLINLLAKNQGNNNNLISERRLSNSRNPMEMFMLEGSSFAKCDLSSNLLASNASNSGTVSNALPIHLKQPIPSTDQRNNHTKTTATIPPNDQIPPHPPTLPVKVSIQGVSLLQQSTSPNAQTSNLNSIETSGNNQSNKMSSSTTTTVLQQQQQQSSIQLPKMPLHDQQQQYDIQNEDKGNNQNTIAPIKVTRRFLSVSMNRNQSELERHSKLLADSSQILKANSKKYNCDTKDLHISRNFHKKHSSQQSQNQDDSINPSTKILNSNTTVQSGSLLSSTKRITQKESKQMVLHLKAIHEEVSTAAPITPIPTTLIQPLTTIGSQQQILQPVTQIDEKALKNSHASKGLIMRLQLLSASQTSTAKSSSGSTSTPTSSSSSASSIALHPQPNLNSSAINHSQRRCNFGSNSDIRFLPLSSKNKQQNQHHSSLCDERDSIQLSVSQSLSLNSSITPINWNQSDNVEERAKKVNSNHSSHFVAEQNNNNNNNTAALDSGVNTHQLDQLYNPTTSTDVDRKRHKRRISRISLESLASKNRNPAVIYTKTQHNNSAQITTSASPSSSAAATATLLMKMAEADETNTQPGVISINSSCNGSIDSAFSSSRSRSSEHAEKLRRVCKEMQIMQEIEELSYQISRQGMSRE